jgi:hypothetical protein
MSSPYDRYDRGPSRSRRGGWGHWVPLVITVTVATAGLAAWVWNQRKDEHDEEGYHEPDLDYENADYGDNPAYGASRDDQPPPPQQPPPDQPTQGPLPPQSEMDAGWGSRMSGALRRTPSPQQFLDSTGRTVAAGVAAAGAVMGKALSSIREEDRPYGGEGNPWSEEADAKRDRPAGSVTTSSSKKRKTVTVIVSADNAVSSLDDDEYHEHAVSHCAAAARLVTAFADSPRHSQFFPISQNTTTSPR